MEIPFHSIQFNVYSKFPVQSIYRNSHNLYQLKKLSFTFHFLCFSEAGAEAETENKIHAFNFETTESSYVKRAPAWVPKFGMK
jgi:hypothetical protein